MGQATIRRGITWLVRPPTHTLLCIPQYHFPSAQRHGDLAEG